jgi:hypothetical protein
MLIRIDLPSRSREYSPVTLRDSSTMRLWPAAPNRVPTSAAGESDRVFATKQIKPRIGVPSLIERGALLVIVASLMLFPLFVRDTRIGVRHTAEQSQTNTARALAGDIQHHLAGFERSLRSASAALWLRNTMADPLGSWRAS